MEKGFTRKTFLKKMGFATASLIGGPFVIGKGKTLDTQLLPENPLIRKLSANDRVNLALIGAGLQGQGNINSALRNNGFKIVAVCDLYDSRLTRCKEVWGKDLFATRDYHQILDRSEVDAVVIATSDHWHEAIAIDALNKGKAVYLEKPMVQHVEEGYRVIEAEQKSGMTLMIGSQLTSSILYQKAGELYRKGEIGVLNFAEAYWDRLSALGAWQYSIPPSASAENVDWVRFLKDHPRIPFNAKHFFRWRNYDAYGTGVAGDLYVHLFSALHMMVDSKGPERIMATGGLRFWHDGRDAEDVMLGLFDYPETESHPAFNLSLRVNFADGSGGGSRIRLVGSEGEIEIGGGRVTLRKSRMPERPGMTIRNFSEETQREYEEYYNEKYPERRDQIVPPSEFIYRAPDGYGSGHHDHFLNFYMAVREKKPAFQNGEFGLRAAGPALLSNASHRDKKIVHWDPVQMKEIT